MTMHQLLTLDQLARHDDGPLNKGEREALKAILAERDVAFELIGDLTSMIELDPEYTPGTDLYTVGEVAKLFIANGGPRCGA